jgi:hypothetical protein
VSDLLEPVAAIVDDTDFWRHTDAGLAVFLDSHELRWFRLPAAVEEAVVVSRRLWVAPLVPFVTAGEVFYVLALSENDVRLLRATRHEIAQLAAEEIPGSMADALKFDDRESQLHSHGADRIGSGQVSATYHGHSASDDFERADRERFLQAVDRGLTASVADMSDPLVLAGVAELVSRFRGLSSYQGIAESFIGGNPEHLTSRELHERALPLVTAYREDKHTDLRKMLGSPTTPTVDTLQETLQAASTGRVATLFMVAGRRAWGSFDAGRQQVTVHQDRRPGDEDLVDVAARETLAHGGEVVAADESEMPPDATLAAVLRY